MKKIIISATLVVVVFAALAMSPLFKTNLTITVRDELGNTVDSADVKLFAHEEDYKKEVNVSYQAFTDAKGVAKFKGLAPIEYYILVRKGDKDNAGGGEKIGKLEEGKFNKSTVVIQ